MMAYPTATICPKKEITQNYSNTLNIPIQGPKSVSGTHELIPAQFHSNQS
uniref:Uncharacterized protein n=1 Tax=Arundo donax TaxID=35708 RepID=A0A0A8Y4Q1_ARUDO